MSPWTCPNGEPHEWQYLGKTAQAYRCKRCQIVSSKADLKTATDLVDLKAAGYLNPFAEVEEVVGA
jgi:hypothetical protein